MIKDRMCEVVWYQFFLNWKMRMREQQRTSVIAIERKLHGGGTLRGEWSG